jgi:pantothenate kinase
LREKAKLQPTVWGRLAGSRLFLDQTDTPLEVDRAQVERFYHPLATTLLTRQSQQSPPNSTSRLMIAVAGPPGSGKTAFATILVAVVNAEIDKDIAIPVGLDGWHYPNEYLATHFIEQGGKRVALQSIKGMPETFDANAAYDCLSEIRQGGRVSFPIYSRRLHEPIPAGGTIDTSHRIVVVEGNYLLLDEIPWKRFRQLFDIRVFILADLEILINSLRGRHLRGGKTPAKVEQHIHQVDLPNARRVASSVARAQVIVHKTDTRRIDRIEKSPEFDILGISNPITT